jgi:hypothetical protein
MYGAKTGNSRALRSCFASSASRLILSISESNLRLTGAALLSCEGPQTVFKAHVAADLSRCAPAFEPVAGRSLWS